MVFLIGCKSKSAKQAISDRQLYDTSITTTTTEEDPFLTGSDSVVAEPPLKRPSGMYQLLIRRNGEPAIEQTVDFRGSDYLLEEKYLANDSVVVKEGTWSPSGKYIWLYHDQLVAGRYTWNGNTLQYYDPQQKRSIAMNKLLPIENNKSLMRKGQEGLIMFGLGNEPFWNVQLDTAEVVTFRLADWSTGVRLQLLEQEEESDKNLYLAANDTSRIRISVLNQFCSDGMSDFTYRYKLIVDYNGRIYRGCALLYPLNSR